MVILRQSLSFFCGTPPLCLKVVGWVVVAYRILLSAPGPFGFNWVLELIGTCLVLGLGSFGTWGSGPGLDNFFKLRKKQVLETNYKGFPRGRLKSIS